MNFIKKQPQGDELDGYFSQQANVAAINRLNDNISRLTDNNGTLKEALKDLGGELSRVLEEKNHLYDRLVVTNEALGKLLGKMAKSAT